MPRSVDFKLSSGIGETCVVRVTAARHWKEGTPNPMESKRRTIVIYRWINATQVMLNPWAPCLGTDDFDSTKLAKRQATPQRVDAWARVTLRPRLG